jgi:acetyltransferase-like isoleucine patch superfamily enzyme
MKRHQLKIRKNLACSGRSKLKSYAELIVGKQGILNLVKYEIIITLFSWIPGAFGLFLRSKLYPLLCGSVGKNTVFGVNVSLRHPHKIYIGEDVIIDDNCLLDAKGVNNNGIIIGNKVFVGRNTIFSCKDGNIVIGNGVNIGFNCEIFTSSLVEIQEDVLMAAYSYVIGGGNYNIKNTNITFAEQEALNSTGILIEDNVWLGAHCVILDGISIGREAVIGAGAVVRQSVPRKTTAVGVPAHLVDRAQNI